ncbi:MAG: S8 family serine peptidase [Cyclobacteriaceae bacterium]
MQKLRMISLAISCLLLISHVSYSQGKRFMLPEGITASDYDPELVVIKLSKSEAQGARFSDEALLSEISQQLPVQQIDKAVTWRLSSAAQSQARRQKQVDIDHIYKIRLRPGQDLLAAIFQLNNMEGIAYAEPYYLLRPLGEYIPNDPAAAKSRGSQAYLSVIKAYEAWGISQGDSSICIGIIDTGIDLGHQDLADNLLRNTADPINGLDDDGDGYVDNFSGWDFADNDNDPTADQNPHGIHASGLAAASTDNKIGMAGTGFSSRFMPIKIFRSADGTFNQGYEAVAYAADQGCKVINLSWGGANAWSQFGQDMINYAVLEKDAVVIAAAGNSNQLENFYPASFDNVLSVGFTDNQDRKGSESTFSYFVDLLAPGVNLHTTGENDTYITASGTSFAAPLVSGAAALLRERFPELNARQVMEKLRLSTDEVYAVGSNSNFNEQLGRGRLNMAKALGESSSPAIRMTAFSYRNPIGQYAFYGDTLSITTDFTNFLRSAGNVKVTLSSPSQHVSLLDSVFNLGALDSLQTSGNAQQPFRVHLHEDLPAQEQIYFRLGVEDLASGYTDYQYFFIVAEPEYTELDNGLLRMALHSDGRIGEGSNRSGFRNQQETLATSMGLIIAASKDSVSDNSITDFDTLSYHRDFRRLERIRYEPSAQADLLLTSAFDDNAAEKPLQLRIEQSWLSDTTGSGQSYLISAYRLINQGADTLTNLYPGIFSDWDLGNKEANRAAWDATHQLAYTHDGSLYAGIALLSTQEASFYAIDKKSLNGNMADLTDAFTDSLKFAWLSAGVGKLAAGVNGAGNDVATLLGAKIDRLAPTRSKTVAFAWAAAASLAELQQKISQARQHYHTYQLNPPLSQVVYVCPDSTARIRPEGGSTFRFYRDALGKDFLAEDSIYQTGPLRADSSIYVSNMDAGFESERSRISLRMLVAKAAFDIGAVSNGEFRNDTLFLNTSGDATVNFISESTNASAWQWHFSNGFSSTRQHPSVKFNDEGVYTISLAVSSLASCPDDTARQLTVVRRAPAPLVSAQTLCYGATATLSASNTNELAFYADAKLSLLIGTGAELVTGPLLKDTTFYLVNTSTTYPSIASELKIRVIQPKLQIAYQVDTSLQSRYLLKIWADNPLQQSVSALEWQVNDQAAGTGDTITYDYGREHAEASPLIIELNYQQTEGDLNCSQQLSRSIELIKSPTPAFSELRICRGASFTLQPQDGKLFYFYADALLDSLIFKGAALFVEGSSENQTFYVTGMDSLRESEAVAVEVMINRFADFSMSSDTLILTEKQEVTFEAFPLALDTQQISWNWDLGDGRLLTRSAQVSQTYDSAGVYEVTLLAMNQEGCTNTISKKLVVKTVSDLEDDPENVSLRIYPNPNRGIITINNLLWDYKKIMLRLYDSKGKALCEETVIYDNFPVEIDLRGLTGLSLQEGIYFISLHSEDRQFFRKLILKD